MSIATDSLRGLVRASVSPVCAVFGFIIWIIKSSNVNVFFRLGASAENGHELGAPHCGLSSVGVSSRFAMGQKSWKHPNLSGVAGDYEYRCNVWTSSGGHED
jgi:hypothetical protein